MVTGCTTISRDQQIATVTLPEEKPAYLFQQGKYHTLKPGIIHWDESENLALIPSGPYLYQQHLLTNPAIDIATDGQHAYLISREKDRDKLLIITFPEKGNTKIISRTALDIDVGKLHYANNRLLLAGKSGGFDLYDVTSPSQPLKLLRFPTNSPVKDIQFDGDSAYLLLDNHNLLKIHFNNVASTRLEAGVVHQWQLPVAASSLAVRNNTVWVTSEQGVGVIRLRKQDAKLTHLVRTSGNPVAVHLYNEFVLITDATGGLVIYSITENQELQWSGSYNKRGAINQIAVPDFLTGSRSASSKAVIATLDNDTIMSIGLRNPELPASGSVYKPDSSIISSTFLGGDVLLLTTNAIQRIKMIESHSSSISPEGVNLGGSRRGVIRDNILYVADWFSGLHLYDISDPRQPRHLSNYHTPGSSKGVTLHDNYALVGDDDQGLQIVEIKDPQQPTWVSELTPASLSGDGLAYTMKRVGNILYLADHRGGFHIIDLTDITHPKRLGGYNTPGKSWGIDVSGQYVFVADDQSGLLIFDASQMANPKLVAQFDPGGQAEDVVIQGNQAYVAFFDRGLYILDIQNPSKPAQLGYISIPGNARGIELSDGLAYVAGWESGLHVVDTRNPESPRILGSFDTDGAVWGINIKDNYVYALDWWGGIKVIDIRDPSSPAYIGQYHARDTLQQMRAHDRYLYAASGAGGLQVFDMKNPLNPIWITGIDIAGYTRDIWHDESRAYVAASDGGVIILDTLDPFYTRPVGQIDTPGEARQVRAWNEYLYISDSEAGIVVVDARNPQHPRELHRMNLRAHDLWVDEWGFWAGTEQGLVWWSHEEGYSADLSHHYPVKGGSNWVRTSGQLVIAGKQEGSIEIWQHSDGRLVKLSDYRVDEAIIDIQVDEKSLYILAENSGLMVFNIQDPRSPCLTTIYPASGLHTGIEIAQGASFFAGENRMASVTLLPPVARKLSANGDIGIQLPPEFPTGDYHLLLTDPEGKKRLFPNALRIQYSSPTGPTNALERYRQLLKSP